MNKKKSKKILTHYNLFQKKHKGISSVIATLLLVLLTLFLFGLLWAVVTSLAEEGLEGAESCIDVFEKVTLNDLYTCYNDSTNEFHFSISIEEIEVEKVFVSISAEGTTKSIEITNENKTVNNLRPYNGNYGSRVMLPEKNAGLTYVYNMSAAGVTGNPDSVRIYPVINKKKCDVSDSITEIFRCTLV